MSACEEETCSPEIIAKMKKEQKFTFKQVQPMNQETIPYEMIYQNEDRLGQTLIIASFSIFILVPLIVYFFLWKY